MSGWATDGGWLGGRRKQGVVVCARVCACACVCVCMGGVGVGWGGGGSTLPCSRCARRRAAAPTRLEQKGDHLLDSCRLGAVEVRGARGRDLLAAQLHVEHAGLVGGPGEEHLRGRDVGAGVGGGGYGELDWRLNCSRHTCRTEARTSSDTKTFDHGQHCRAAGLVPWPPSDQRMQSTKAQGPWAGEGGSRAPACVPRP